MESVAVFDFASLWGDVSWSTIGVVTTLCTLVVGAILWIANKIFKFGLISQRLTDVEKSMSRIEREIDGARVDLTKRVDELMIAIVQKRVTRAHSPRRLNAEGQRVLEDSGIQQIVEKRYGELLKRVKDRSPPNPYRAERIILDEVQKLNSEPALKSQLEEGAFCSGSLIDVVLYVGGIYIRDRILSELGMNSEDIDKHGVSRKSKKAKK